MPAIANTPQPPYYAVIFTSLCTEGDDGYDVMSERMLAGVSSLSAQTPPYDPLVLPVSARAPQWLNDTVFDTARQRNIPLRVYP